MQFCHRVPVSPLDSCIESIWICQNDPRPHALERILPTGSAQLIVNLKEGQTRLYDPDSPYRCISTAGSVLSGVQTRFQVIDTSEQEYVAGVAFSREAPCRCSVCPRTKRVTPTFPSSRSGLSSRCHSARAASPKPHDRRGARCARSGAAGDVAATRAAPGRCSCPRRVRSKAVDNQHCRSDERHRAERKAIHRTVQARSGRNAEALLSHSPVPARLDAVASRPSGRLDARGDGLRLLRSSALHSRLPIVRGHYADGVSVIEDVVSESRQISTIRHRRHLRR